MLKTNICILDFEEFENEYCTKKENKKAKREAFKEYVRQEAKYYIDFKDDYETCTIQDFMKYLDSLNDERQSIILKTCWQEITNKIENLEKEELNELLEEIFNDEVIEIIQDALKKYNIELTNTKEK